MELRKVSLFSPIFLTPGYISTNSRTPHRPSPRLSSSLSANTTQQRRSAHHSCSWPSHGDLTPYTILGLQPGEPYSKSRYYDLVKIYHPDRFRTVNVPLSRETRAQRYGLVVAAHEILVDPGKRWAYDRYGVGWTSSSRVMTRGRSASDSHAYSHEYNYNNYSNSNSNDKGNTWTWIWNTDFGFNTSQDLQHQRLAVLILVIAFFMQCCFFSAQCFKADLQARSLHDQCRKLVDSRRRRALSLGVSDAQMEGFLLKRDPAGVGVTELERGIYGEVLPLCSSGLGDG